MTAWDLHHRDREQEIERRVRDDKSADDLFDAAFNRTPAEKISELLKRVERLEAEAAQRDRPKEAATVADVDPAPQALIDALGFTEGVERLRTARQTHLPYTADPIDLTALSEGPPPFFKPYPRHAGPYAGYVADVERRSRMTGVPAAEIAERDRQGLPIHYDPFRRAEQAAKKAKPAPATAGDTRGGSSIGKMVALDEPSSVLRQFAEKAYRTYILDAPTSGPHDPELAQFDPMIILMIVSVIIQVYKICNSFPEREKLNHIPPVWKWVLRRAIRQALRDEELERKWAKPLARALVNQAEGWHPSAEEYLVFSLDVMHEAKQEV